MGILPSFLSREDQLWTDFATSSRLGYVAADEEVTNRGEDSSKVLLDGDWPGTIKGHAIASRIFRSESVSIPLLERVEESFGAHQPASINAGDFIGNTAHFAIPCALPQMHATKQSAEQTELVSLFGGVQTESGRALLELIDESPVLLIFLRHFGCAFCRQALDQVSKIRDQIAARRTRPVFVHLGTKERAKLYFDYYNLSDVERVGNPDASLYQHPLFALGRINPYLQLFNPAVIKGWVKGAMRRYGIGMIHEDAHQMPGIFFLQDRRIVRGFRYQSIADEPDYVKLIDG